MTFRLTTLLYLFALVAASAAVMGAWGLLAGPYIFWGWIMVNRDPRLLKTWKGRFTLLVWFVFIPGMIFAMLQPPVISGGHDRWTPSHLRQLALAINSYHEDHGEYPPLYVADANGVPLYSWRVLLLPYLEQQAIADQFKHDEPWDSPSNIKLLVDIPAFQGAATNVTGGTHFLAIVGDGTMWNCGQTTTADDVTDGLEKTLLLIDAPDLRVKWSEPRDLTMAEAIDRLNAIEWEEKLDKGYFISRRYRVCTSPVCYVALADGSVERLPPGIDRATAEALCTRAGGEALKPFDDPSWDFPSRHLVEKTVHWHRFTSLALWIAIILLPFNRRVSIFSTNRT